MSTETPPAETGNILETGKRFSESIIWTLMRRYYAEQGPRAWHSGEVPSYATCNTYIAKTYAYMVMAFLRDAKAAGHIDPKKPVYIVELAAGVGRFAYLFLNKLTELKAQSSLRDLDVRYVMTDFTKTNLDVWSTHPHLAPFVKEGILHFGQFDVEVSKEVKLLDGSVISAATNVNPIAVLANYAFDTFTHDLFRINEGVMHEVLVTAAAPMGQTADTVNLQNLKLQYDYRPVGAKYYDDPALQQVLDGYRNRLAELGFTIPIGGLRGVRTLVDIAHGKLMLVSSDKGFTHENELFHPQPYNLQFHGSAVMSTASMMVNYHAVGQYFAARGGHYVSTARNLQLKTAVGLLGDAREYADTLLAAQEHIATMGPGEFFEMVNTARQDKRNVTIANILFMLRQSGWDPFLVMDYAKEIREQVQAAPEHLQLDLAVALEHAWANFFPSPQNLPFELGRIFMAMRKPLESIRFNKIGIEWYGEMPPAFLNMGISYYYAEQPEEAERCFKRALELNNTFGMAHEWLARVRAERALRESSRVARPIDVAAMVSSRVSAIEASPSPISGMADPGPPSPPASAPPPAASAAPVPVPPDGSAKGYRATPREPS